MPPHLIDLHGILNLDKPPGVTSAAVVGRVKRLLGGRVKVGHAGTLDSFATGVLLVLVGRATKRCETLMAADKEYVATVRLGETTETLDPLSPTLPRPVPHAPTADAVRAALATQVGTILQTPPLFSALKVGGRRASDRARAGEALTLPPRPVRIDAADLLAYDWPTLDIRIVCGRGTYVRSIARDVAETLGTGGYLTALRRTRVGQHAVAASLRPDDLTPERLHAALADTDRPAI